MKTVFAILAAVTVATCASAQEPATTPKSDGVVQDGAATYFLQISQHRSAQALPTPFVASRIMEMIADASDDSSISLVQTIGLSVVPGTEASVEFTRSVGYTSATTSVGNREMAKLQNFLEVGTELHVRASPNKGKIAVELVYESSSIDGDFVEGHVPAVSKIEASSTYYVVPGEPIAIAISGAGETTVVSLVLTE